MQAIKQEDAKWVIFIIQVNQLIFAIRFFETKVSGIFNFTYSNIRVIFFQYHPGISHLIKELMHNALKYPSLSNRFYFFKLEGVSMVKYSRGQNNLNRI